MKGIEDLNATELQMLSWICKSIDKDMPLPKKLSDLQVFIAKKKEEAEAIYKSNFEYLEMLERLLSNIEHGEYKK
jgi:hypothetical protein